jgi:hypothetical protein
VNQLTSSKNKRVDTLASNFLSDFKELVGEIIEACDPTQESQPKHYKLVFNHAETGSVSGPLKQILDLDALRGILKMDVKKDDEMIKLSPEEKNDYLSKSVIEFTKIFVGFDKIDFENITKCTSHFSPVFTPRYQRKLRNYGRILKVLLDYFTNKIDSIRDKILETGFGICCFASTSFKTMHSMKADLEIDCRGRVSMFLGGVSIEIGEIKKDGHLISKAISQLKKRLIIMHAFGKVLFPNRTIHLIGRVYHAGPIATKHAEETTNTTEVTSEDTEPNITFITRQL